MVETRLTPNQAAKKPGSILDPRAVIAINEHMIKATQERFIPLLTLSSSPSSAAMRSTIVRNSEKTNSSVLIPPTISSKKIKFKEARPSS